MRRLLLGLAALLGAAGPAAQTVATGPTLARLLPAGTGNDVRVLDTDSTGRLYAGPRLVVVAPDGSVTFPGADRAFNPPTALDASVFSLATAGQSVYAGLGFLDTAADANAPPPTAAGFAVSRDGGATFTRRFPSLDETGDTLVAYGVSNLVAVPTLAPQGAAPLDLALTAGGDTAYVAAGLAGLRRSTDGGATWRRIVLPPDSLTVLDPRVVQTFAYSPGQVEPPDPAAPTAIRFAFASANFIAYSVLVDETGTVWAGTANGLNRSIRLPDASDPAWLRYLDGPLGGGPPANIIAALAAQPVSGARDRIWMAARNSGLPASSVDEEDGVAVYTGDDAEGRAQFVTVLPGVAASGFAFHGAKAYVAGRADGLFLTDDALSDLTTSPPVWRAVRTFRDAAGVPLALRDDAPVIDVAVAPTGLWAGTPDGLLQSTDNGLSWTLFRASPAPGLSRDSVAVDVYAYPNPFRPGTQQLLRIRFDQPAPADVTVRVYDVSMRVVRTLEAPARPAGPVEVLWDGRTDGGLRVANGAYIYTVEAGGERLSGRILVFE